MKNFQPKICLLVLLFSCGILVKAQLRNYKMLSRELQTLQKQLVPDKRTAVLNVELKDTLQPVIALSGEANLPEAKNQILRFMHSKQVAFVDSVRLLPDTVVGEMTWALASVSVANMRSRPDHLAELVSQVLMGTPMKVLDKKDNWYRVQTPEYYIGWIDSGGLHRFAEPQMQTWRKSARSIYHHLNGFVYNDAALRSSTISDLVEGDLFEVLSEQKGFFKIRMPDGRTGFVPKEDCLSFDEWSKTNPEASSMLAFTQKLMGFPYLWGGVSVKAMDCSGMVKMALYMQGVILARDASQQARCGVALDTGSLQNLQPGDLLFFGSSAQRITHVGIYLGNGDFIHSSGKVSIGSIVPGDPKYNPARKYVAACRVLNSLNTEGITRVKNHPWYTVQP